MCHVSNFYKFEIFYSESQDDIQNPRPSTSASSRAALDPIAHAEAQWGKGI